MALRVAGSRHSIKIKFLHDTLLFQHNNIGLELSPLDSLHGTARLPGL